MDPADQSSTGIAGHSAQREHDRRHTARRERAKARYGPVGTLLASVTADPATIQAWQQGAGGEIATARELASRLRRSDVIVIHDRRIPGRGRANIDHLTVGPGGVTVIDTKSSRGEIHITTAGVLRRREQLLVNGRDRTRQLDALQRQIAAVTRVLDRQAVAGVSVLGALCYPYGTLPIVAAFGRWWSGTHRRGASPCCFLPAVCSASSVSTVLQKFFTHSASSGVVWVHPTGVEEA